MPGYESLVFSPMFLIIHKDDFEAEDEFAAVEVAMFRFEEKYGSDPEARLELKEHSNEK